MLESPVCDGKKIELWRKLNCQRRSSNDTTVSTERLGRAKLGARAAANHIYSRTVGSPPFAVARFSVDPRYPHPRYHHWLFLSSVSGFPAYRGAIESGAASTACSRI